jgi:RNA polymerase sigma-70 factor (ECF subfamily)
MPQAESPPPVRPARAPTRVSAFLRYARELKRFLGRRVLVSHDADDLAQEVYLRLLRLDVPQNVQNPLAFIYTVAANVLCDYKAAARRAGESVAHAHESLENDMGPVSEALADRLEDSLIVSQELENALAQLPPTHAAVMILRERDGMSWDEIAARANLSPHTVKKYLFEGRALLRMKILGSAGSVR